MKLALKRKEVIETLGGSVTVFDKLLKLGLKPIEKRHRITLFDQVDVIKYYGEFKRQARQS